MKSPLLPEDLDTLVCEGGFRNEEAVLSLALSIGVFHGAKGSKDEVPEGTDLERLVGFDLSAFILSGTSYPEVGIDEMRHLLMQHLAGGISMMEKKIGKKRGMDALKTIAGMLPP